MGDPTTKPPSEVLQPIIDNCFRPNADALSKIIGRGEVAVVVFKLDESDALALQAARDIGWDGTSVVFQLAGHTKKRLIEVSEQQADPVTARWLRGGRTGRIFLWTGRGTLLINYQPGAGYSVEPGSTDASRAQA
jgi:hypothetical protein